MLFSQGYGKFGLRNSLREKRFLHTEKKQTNATSIVSLNEPWSISVLNANRAASKSLRTYNQGLGATCYFLGATKHKIDAYRGRATPLAHAIPRHVGRVLS